MITGIVLALIATLTGLYLGIRSFFGKDSTGLPLQTRLAMFAGLLAGAFFLAQTMYQMKSSARQLKEAGTDATDLDKAFEKMD